MRRRQAIRVSLVIRENPKGRIRALVATFWLTPMASGNRDMVKVRIPGFDGLRARHQRPRRAVTVIPIQR